MKIDNIKTYKIPQDLICDILRITFNNGIKHSIKNVHQQNNIITVEMVFDGIDDNEPKNNIESMLEDYREYMKDIIGDAILNINED